MPPLFYALAALGAAMWSLTAAEQQALSFNRAVRPILADHCFACHGQDEKTRKSGLRLDRREDALHGGKSKKPAIVPGELERSEIIVRLTTHDVDDVMPPANQKNPVSAAQLETLKQWIREGAPYEGHWAFSAPSKPPVPEISSAGLVVNPIDNFVLARLAREGLNGGPEAPPETLIRRVSLDITGIPPTPSETDLFLGDYAKNGNDAYVRLVDRLLGSPRYGEKWARWWLDAARYADSDGYEKDLPRDQWTWRDWVIASLNRDKPYDDFIVEQIAGDLLARHEAEFSPKAQELRVATGFLRNGMVNEEGAVINEQFRLDGMFDRMDVVGKSVLGLSLQCGQCHSHKFDPLTQEEYYRIFAFLNDTYEATTWVYTPAQLERISAIHRAIRKEEEEIKKRLPDWSARIERWEAEVREKRVDWTPLDCIENEWMDGLAHPQKQKDKSILTLGFRPTAGELWVTAIVQETNITALRLEALTHGDLPFNGPGRSYKGTFALSEFTVESAPVSIIGAHTNHAAEIKAGLQKLPLGDATADIEAADQLLSGRFARQDEKRRVGPAAYLIDGKDDTAWSTDLGAGRRNGQAQVVMKIATNHWAAAEGTFLKATLKFRHGGSDGHGRDNNFLGRFRLAYTTAPDPLKDPLPAGVRAALERPSGQRTPEQRAEIFDTWRKSVPELREFNERIVSAFKDYPEGETVLNLAARGKEWHRDTTIYERGNWQKPGRTVEPGVPAFLHPLREGAPADRLAFGRWLVDPRSPTTARVAVNRVWQSIFGLGLVETPEDFGVRSSLPVNPDLLDWLSVSFMEGTVSPLNSSRPWSLKQVIRAIVLSATYRQDSRFTSELLDRDPLNKLLSRGPRFRAESELVRDIALSASGLLHEQIGGRSFYPPVPESMFALNFVKIDWNPAPAPERYRRSVYLFRRRSMPDPVMASLDAPNGDLACVRRVRSNTPLAALACMNEPVFVEAAQALALRTIREGGKADDARANFAFRLCTGRAPRPAEAATILELLHSRQQRIADGWLPARELALGDAAMPRLPDGVTPKELAAWTLVSRVLLNLDETLTKN